MLDVERIVEPAVGAAQPRSLIERPERAAFHEPAWLWIGGLLSVYIVLAITVGPPRIGVAATIGIVIAGNLVMAALIDRYGLFGQDVIPIDRWRLLGLVLVAAGAALLLSRT